MQIEGTVHNGVVVLETDNPLPDGTRVTVTPHEGVRNDSTGAGLLWLAGAIQDMPADFSEEHNHYIHGAPRRSPVG